LLTLDPQATQEPFDISQQIEKEYDPGADGQGQEEEAGFRDLVGLGREKVDHDHLLIELPQGCYEYHYGDQQNGNNESHPWSFLKTV
jgi:hypothetical protein